MCFGTGKCPVSPHYYSWPSFLSMAWWNKVFGTSGETERVAYYDEGLSLLADDKVHEALTSFRLALKASPGDIVVLQQIAIAYTRIGTFVCAPKHMYRS